jgi:hypothetical protein
MEARHRISIAIILTRTFLMKVEGNITQLSALTAAYFATLNRFSDFTLKNTNNMCHLPDVFLTVLQLNTTS